MKKVLLSTAKVAVLFIVSTFFAYMILRAQIKHSSKKSVEKTTVKEKITEPREEIDTSQPVLTYVGSSKADTNDVNLDVDDIDLTYFDSSKAGDFDDLHEIIISPSAFAQPGKKKHINLEPDTLDKNGKELKPEFFHSSKAVLTTVVIENVEGDSVPERNMYLPTSKSATIDILPYTNDEAPNSHLRKRNNEVPISPLIKAESLQLRIFDLEEQIRQLKAQIAKLRK
ncbi:MAG: hypothetical protein NE328_12520 [Lentisphaeraceae bacterium]|nr:hypothetical protein [Lentisphaeraceae bacterium]